MSLNNHTQPTQQLAPSPLNLTSLPPENLAIPGSGLIDLGFRVGCLTWSPRHLSQHLINNSLVSIVRHLINSRITRKGNSP